MIYPLSMKFFFRWSMFRCCNFDRYLIHPQVLYDDEDCVCVIKLHFLDFCSFKVSVIRIVGTVFESEVAKVFQRHQ